MTLFKTFSRLPLRLTIMMSAIGISAVSYQNCGGGFKANSADGLSTGTSFCLVNAGDAACSQTRAAAVTCSFNGATLLEGQSVTAFINSNSANGACASETRTCSSGSLSGSYAYASCASGAAKSCLFNGQTLADGASTTAYLSAGGADQPCQSQTRTCAAGTLSGNYAYASCQTSAAASCLFNGQTIAHGSFVTAYVGNTAPRGQTCQALTRTCFNGTLSGQGEYASCTVVDTNKSCLFNGMTIANGQTVNAFPASTVPAGQTCTPIVRSCQNGVLSQSGEYASCQPAQDATCMINGQSAQAVDCMIKGQSAPAAACMINGQTIASGGGITLYKQAQAGDDGLCPTEQRVCTDGKLAGSATFSSCTVPDKVVCGADVVNKPNVDASAALTACFEKKVSLYELVPGRYFVSNEIVFSNRSNVTVRTQNLASGPACLSPGAGACAIITAMPSYNGTIWTSTNLSHVNLEHFAIDGNIGPRRKMFPKMNWGGMGAYNSRFTCDGCVFHGFASVRSAHGSGLEFSGDNAVFDTVLFRDNGWGSPNDLTRSVLPNGQAGNSPWSDGLTIGKADNLHIMNSVFRDNSDVNLILGDSRNSIIENNQIGNKYNYAFAAFMWDNFNSPKFKGDFTGSIFRGNMVDCGNGMCGIGIMVGPHFWYPSNPITGGTITGNSVTGARQGILVSGANGVEISGNTVNVFGIYKNAACTTDFISVSSGDNANVHDNNHAASANHISACGPENLFTLLSDFNGTDPEISRLFREVLGRDPDIDGGRAFSAAYAGGASLQSLRSQFSESEELKSRLDDLYRKTLGRPIDSDGLANLKSTLANGGKYVELYVKLRLTDEGLQYRTATD